MSRRDEEIGTDEEERAKLFLRQAKREAIFKERRQKPVTPGPGTNSLPTMFGGRVEDRFGRCANKPSCTVPASPAFSLSGRREEPSVEVEVEVGPGPGLYNPKKDVMEKRSRGCIFGTQARMLSTTRRTVTPGPSLVQDVEDQRYIRSPRIFFTGIDRTKYGACSPRAQARGCRAPGPGQHDPNHTVSSKLSTGPDYSFGRRDHHEPDKAKTGKETKGPGPLTYETVAGEAWILPATPRCSFGTSPRMRNETSKQTPGPGHYSNVNATCRSIASVAESAPKWSMTGRAARHKLDFHTF